MKKQTKEWSQKDEGLFVKMYIEHMGLILKLSPSEQKVLIYALKFMGQTTNIFSMNTHHKNEMIKANNNLGDVAIYHALSSLVKKKMLFRLEKGVYKANPQYFAKAKWERVLAMRWSIVRRFNKSTYKVTLYEPTPDSKMSEVELEGILEESKCK